MIGKRILVTPLDWGLGHATRCIPVIRELQAQGGQVFIASSGSALLLLKEEFGEITFFELASYQPVYASKNLLRSLILQLPRFIKVIGKEHIQVREIIDKNSIDIVISDNRYGCWSIKTLNILITHQLTLLVPVMSSLVNFFHERALAKFSAWWVPDVQGENSLAGKLALNPRFNVKHVGVLSRMEWRPAIIQYEILAIVSGPEPQRTIFERIIRRELRSSGRRCLIIKGLPGDDSKSLGGPLEEINHLSSREMNQVILESEIIISRSGYSTIMDLAVLGKKAIFIPTPGQVEQEYLASELMKKGVTFSMHQDNFNLQEALEQSGDYSGFKRINKDNYLKDVIEEILK